MLHVGEDFTTRRSRHLVVEEVIPMPTLNTIGIAALLQPSHGQLHGIEVIRSGTLGAQQRQLQLDCAARLQ